MKKTACVSDIAKKRPYIFFQKIVFNDNTELRLHKNSIVVFTGANNCGKSQVLRDLENCIENDNQNSTKIIIKSQRYYFGDIDEKTFLEEHFYKRNDDYYEAMVNGSGYNLDTLKYMWSDRHLNNELYKFFAHRLRTEDRLNASDALVRQGNAQNHPIYKLFVNSSLANSVSEYFRQAFGVDLVVNEKDLTTIPLHVGNAPDADAYKMKDKDEYYKIIANLPKLQEQGDGMRSFASILLNAFTSEYPIMLIDEPEAFLHPPQARILGKMLAKNNPNYRQLFISTHSEDFLQGLLDADNENVTVIRINRIDKINKMSILSNDRIRHLWRSPIFRYSNILSGLFHSKVVICESDYDCLFYQAMINAIYEQKKDIAPDILFTHCGGKSRMKDIVYALKAVNVPVIAITDFDLMEKRDDYISLMDAFGIKWKTKIRAELSMLENNINTKKSKGIKVWDELKKKGEEGLSEDEKVAYMKIKKACKASGLFVVPVGEMECFDKTICPGKKGREWVYALLDKYNMAKEPKLENARAFVKEIVKYS